LPVGVLTTAIDTSWDDITTNTTFHLPERSRIPWHYGIKNSNYETVIQLNDTNAKNDKIIRMLNDMKRVIFIISYQIWLVVDAGNANSPYL